MLTWNVYLNKCTHVKVILKNLIQRKKLSIHLLVTPCLQIVHLMQQRINSIETEVKTVWKEHAMKIINFEEKEMIPVTNEGNEYYEMQKVCHIRKKQKNLVLIKMMKIYLNYIIQ